MSEVQPGDDLPRERRLTASPAKKKPPSILGEPDEAKRRSEGNADDKDESSDRVPEVIPVALPDESTPLAQRQRTLRWRAFRIHNTVFFLSLFIIVCAFLMRVRPDEKVEFIFVSGYPVPKTCYARNIWGVKCPGCGLTRSFIFLAHGEWEQALARHRLGWLMAFTIVVQIPFRIIAVVRPERPPLGRTLTSAYSIFVVVIFFSNWFAEIMMGQG
jgi:hypothetical protein